MRLRGPLFGVALAGVAACGGDGTGPGATAASVTGVAGDNQTAPTGTALGVPLSFVALNSQGQPVQGVRVTWAASPGGSASFSPSVDTTDANGAVSTTVTTTTFIGNITMTASVPGVSAGVVYHATVVDPCTFLAPFALGQTVNGFLSSTDCNRSNFGFYYDYHGLTLPTGQQSIRIAMRGTGSSPFDTWVDFWSATGPYIAFDDDSILGTAQNSQLDIILPGGNYIIGASSFNQFTTGPYSLAVTTRAAALNGCRQVWVTRGVTVSDSVTLSDCADSAVTPHYYDVARIIVFDTTTLQIAERSAAIDPSLALYVVRPESNYVRHLVASNDDSSAGNHNAFIRYQVDTSNVYDIVISTSAGGQTGAYTFSVDTTTTLSPRRSAPPNGRREWWRASPSELLLRSRGWRGAKL